MKDATNDATDDAARGPPTVELDLRGLKCPLPVLRTRKALRRLAPGAALIVLATDPLAAIDIPHFLRTDGHRLDRQSTADGVTCFSIVKATP